MHKIKTSICVFLVLLTSLLTGCASQMQLSKQDKASLHTIYINPTVKKIPDMYYVSRTQMASQMFVGLIGTAATYKITEREKETILKMADKNGIDIVVMVRNSITQQLKNSPYKIVNTPNADASMQLQINMYGFSPLGAAIEESPVLGLRAELINRQNKVIWRGGNIFPTERTAPRFTYDELTRNPENIRKAWHYVADKVATDILSGLVKDSA